MREQFVDGFELFVFSSLGEHEGTEFLKLCFEVGCVLFFLKIAQLGVFHRRYYYNLKTNHLFFYCPIFSLYFSTRVAEEAFFCVAIQYSCVVTDC
jgi:hypothetical protein